VDAAELPYAAEIPPFSMLRTRLQRRANAKLWVTKTEVSRWER
jgi:hypothetical protein